MYINLYFHSFISFIHSHSEWLFWMRGSEERHYVTLLFVFYNDSSAHSHVLRTDSHSLTGRYFMHSWEVPCCQRVIVRACMRLCLAPSVRNYDWMMRSGLLEIGIGCLLFYQEIPATQSNAFLTVTLLQKYGLELRNIIICWMRYKINYSVVPFRCAHSLLFPSFPSCSFFDGKLAGCRPRKETALAGPPLGPGRASEIVLGDRYVRLAADLSSVGRRSFAS